MNTAAKGKQMNGYIAGPFQVDLGTHQFSIEIYVAPIEEEMLLGAFTIYSPSRVSLRCASTLMTELGDTIHPLTRNIPVSFSRGVF
jgi:hypothetical protein